MHPQPQLADQAARDRIRTSLDESLIVEASAGTGKTTELVNRIVAVLAAGKTTVEKIAAVTFTHKAAGELKLRLRQELDRARQQDQAARPALEDALAHLEEASIGTIHSFCAQILRERPVEARVDPAFEELSEQDADRIYLKAFRTWLERRLNDDSPGLRRAFARLAHRDSWDDSPPIEQLQFAGRKLKEWRDYPALWRREPFAREEEIGTLVRMAFELADGSARPRRVTDNLYRGLEPVRLLAQWIAQAEASTTRDYDTLESLLLKLGRDLARDLKKGSGEYGGGVLREDLVQRREELLRWIAEFKARADADLVSQLREEMLGLIDEYEARKQRLGKLDFVDLLVKTRDLVQGNAEIRAYLQDRFTHLFIDEFQDTDPLQAEILLLLSGGDSDEADWLKVTPKPGKLFLVGDPKQSIYKFRRADLVMYQEVREALEQRGVGVVSLTASFRSTRNIQQFVNAAFENEMPGHWAPLERFRGDLNGRPSVIALPVPRPYQSRLAKKAVNKCLPDTIAAFIAWLVNDSGWEIKASDIAVLFRRRTQGGTDLTREYARALEARGIAHLLAGSKSFHKREEIETLRVALTAIEWPEDELSVFATLKGSLFAIPDEMLLLFRHKHGHLHPFRKIEDPGFVSLLAALDLLARLHRERNRRPFASTVNDLLEATRASAGFVLRPGGNQILANVGRFAEMARAFEISGGVSFRGFVEELMHQAEKEEASEAPVLEEDSDGVRLMTVHSAKGLQFKVVILADITANLQAREPDQYVDGVNRLAATRLLHCAPWELRDNQAVEADRERAEGIRVAYVAATRAQDLLVIPAVGDEVFPQEGWLSPLNKALYPSRENWRSARPAEGCPNFGLTSVLERPADYEWRDEPSVRPGLIQPAQGSHEVVWWDPSRLLLNEDGDELHEATLKRILAEDDGKSLKTYQDWQEARAATIHHGSKPQFEVFLPSQAVESPPQACAVEYVSIPHGRSPSGKRFGTLVHAVLAEIPLDAGESQIRQLAHLQGRIFGAPGEEVQAAVEAVTAALSHPVMKLARAAQRCHREYPLTLLLENGRMLEGVIDMAFVESGSWVVVDFKTDSAITDSRESYERQLQWYTYALGRLTGMTGRAVLLGL